MLANAIKYNRVAGRVTVSCMPADRGWLRTLVRDTGAGISRQDLQKLFVPFERLDAARGQTEGTGIGLALCKRLVEMMGGAIGVESAVGEGSTFWFELPPADRPTGREAGEHEGGTPAIAAETGQTSTVLYIEDNVSNADRIRHLLGEVGHVRLLSTVQGRLGLELAREHRPNLILLDLHLPDIPGDEVLRRLRAEAGTRDIPVAILSADATPGTIERLLDAGAAAYLTRPLDVRRVLHVLHDTLAARPHRVVAPALSDLGAHGDR